jgi:riboflavin kinase / FMN adenylyltransferase
MQFVRHLNESGWNLASAVLTLGNFDGLHLGHRALIEGAVADAMRLDVPSVVLTFEPHPLKVLAPERAPKLILCHKDKLRMLQSFAVSIVAVQPFDRNFANVDAEEFVRNSLIERLKAKKIWVGRDFRFGRGRKAGVEELIRWGGQHGFEVTAVEPVIVDGERVSSSRVRQLLADGRVREAKSMLGRYHFVSGRVVEGLRRGRRIGYPTANIAPWTEVLPQDGIYATLFHIAGRSLLSVSSVGRNPTFGEGPRTVESHIMDFDDNIYAQEVSLSYVERLRPEAKFESVPALIAQIDQDVLNAQAVFQRLNLQPSP